MVVLLDSMNFQETLLSQLDAAEVKVETVIGLSSPVITSVESDEIICFEL